MTEQVLLAIIACVGTVATIGGTCFGAYMTWKMAALKADQEKNAAASKKRYEKLDETCRVVEAKTDAQTDLLNEMAPPGKRVKPVRPEDSGYAARPMRERDE